MSGRHGDIEEPHDRSAEMIAERAYAISQSPDAGTPEEDWARAERELREEAGVGPAPASTSS